jgi:hypothetical protein
MVPMFIITTIISIIGIITINSGGTHATTTVAASAPDARITTPAAAPVGAVTSGPSSY